MEAPQGTEMGYQQLLSNPTEVPPPQETSNAVPWTPRRLWHIIYILSALCLILLVGLIVVLAVYNTKDDGNEDVDYPSLLFVSDVHTDLFYQEHLECTSLCRPVYTNWTRAPCGPIEIKDSKFNATYGRYHCDSPLELVEATFRSMAGVQNHPLFVAIGGDFVAHGIEDIEGLPNSTRAILDAIDTVAQSLIKAFPSGTVFLPTFGNNDWPHDYRMPSRDDELRAWLTAVLDVWNPLFGHATADVSTFVPGGYYKVSNIPAAPKLMVLVLNTVIYSRFGSPLPPNLEKIANDQLAWMKKALAKAEEEGQRVIILGHIPPGTQARSDMNEWDTKWSGAYVKTVLEYASVIAAQLYGHWHMDDFKILTPPGEPMSPDTTIFHAFRESFGFPLLLKQPLLEAVFLDVEGGGHLMDVKTFTLDLVNTFKAREYGDGVPVDPVWEEEYTFLGTYGKATSGTLGEEGLLSLFDHLIRSGNLWRKFSGRYRSGYFSDRFPRHCAQRYQNQADYDSCLDAHPFYDFE